MRHLTKKKKIFFIPIAVAAFLALISFIIMQLWNNLLPDILNASQISFWQALGLFILCKILFGFGHGGRMGPPWMRNNMRERFRDMSPEEKQHFKEQWKNRMCWKTDNPVSERPNAGWTEGSPGNA